MSIATDLVRRGAVRLAPGVYSLDGEMHLDADELLRADGLEPTEANQERLYEIAKRVCQERGIPIELEEHAS